MSHLTYQTPKVQCMDCGWQGYITETRYHRPSGMTLCPKCQADAIVFGELDAVDHDEYQYEKER